MLLIEEASIREMVGCIQNNFSMMLKALGELAFANPVFAHAQLPSLVSIFKLLASGFISSKYFLIFSCEAIFFSFFAFKLAFF